jgi:nitrile hydratase subunit alpha
VAIAGTKSALDAFAYPPDREDASAAKVAALESLLIEKGVITEQTVDKVLAYFESEMTPLNGKKIVVTAWTDPGFAQRVVADTPSAIAELDLPLGMAGAEGEHLRAVANGPGVHNLVICTLCSCFPWPVLGLPPYWYKDPVFRARAAREPRKVLAEVGVDLPDDTEIRVWDASGASRWFVIPERPAGTEDFTNELLMDLVTTESMMGVALAGRRHDRRHEDAVARDLHDRSGRTAVRPRLAAASVRAGAGAGGVRPLRLGRLPAEPNSEHRGVGGRAGYRTG